MKTISERIHLKGSKLEQISMTELRSKPGEVIDLVNLGATYLVTKQGKPIAVISKVPGEQLSIEVSSNGTVNYKL